MNILVQYNPKSGGSYHRVKLWSSYLVDSHKITYSEKITEEEVKDVDIVYIHWTSNTSLVKLSIWREKYQFKLVADIDDSWSGLEDKYKGVVFLSQHLANLADLVICSTEEVEKQVRDWNSNTTVIPNLLPYGEGQFKPNKKKRDKIRVGIGGSISHYDDYMSLKRMINQLEKEKWFKSKCEFVIIGWTKDPKWRKIKSMFNQVKIFNSRPVETYMSLYDEVDIMLLPLKKTKLNDCRSNLKVHECLCKDAVPLLGEGYKGKEYINAKLPSLSIKNLKRIVDGERIVTKSTMDYEEWCVTNRLFHFRDTIDLKPKPRKHNLWSIIYKEDQDVEYQRYLNTISTVEEKSYLFEYNPIIDILDRFDEDGYVGIFSHRFPHKTGFYKKYVEQVLDNEKSDIVIFCKQYKNYFTITEKHHQGFTHIFKILCSKLKLHLPTNIDSLVTVYSNFFAMKAEVYQEYVKVLKSAIHLMETDHELRVLCWQNANYTGGLNQEDLKKYTGLNCYTFHTFLLERLISVWIYNQGFSFHIYQ